MTVPYLTLEQYKTLSQIARPTIDKFCETPANKTFIESWLEQNSASIEAQLRKRYKTPFVSPFPKQLGTWLVWLTDVPVWMRRGVSSTDEQYAEYVRLRDLAFTQIREAADSEKGLYDLPLLETGDASAITKQGPRSYSETSPYVWQDVQRSIARDEDSWGEGTRRG